MSQGKKGTITIANIIALVGLAGIGVVTFFGILFHSSDGTPGGAIIGAVVLLAVLSFLLMMSIKAKSADNNPDKWRYVEWACIVLYIVVAGSFATPFQRFFYITTEKATLQAMAREEVKTIKEMYQSYEHQQKKYLTDAVEQIKNYNDSKQISLTYNNELTEYVKGVGSNVDSWESKATLIVKLQPDKELSDIEGEIEVWNILNLPSLALRIEMKDKGAWTSIEKKIREYGEKNKLIPVIGGGGNQSYYFDGYAKFDLGNPPEPKFSQALRASNGNTVLGWIVYVVLNLLVLLNYVVTLRSQHVGPVNGRRTNGMDL